MNPLVLQSYLKFGYSLKYKNPNYALNFSNINKEKYANANEDDLIKLGSKLLLEEFSKVYSSSEKYLVPISGGVDSRAIMGLVLQYREAKNILTYTFGTPGTLDYDIGNYLAKKLGTQHVSFDLTKHKYTEQEFLDTSQRFDFQSPLFLHPPLHKLDEYYKGTTIISGANAGAVVGSFVPVSPALTIEEASLRFFNKSTFSRSRKLFSCSNADFLNLVSVTPIDPKLLSYDEQIFFNERSVKHLAPHVLLKGFNYILPFINNSFMDLMLSVDNKYRFHKSLYKKIIYHTFPELFHYPIEGNYGLKLTANKNRVKLRYNYIKVRQRLCKQFPSFLPYTSPMINYLDFNKYFRENENIKQIINEALICLQKRAIIPWIDINEIWETHQKRKQNLADCILLLFSLEYHIRAGKNIYE